MQCYSPLAPGSGQWIAEADAPDPTQQGAAPQVLRRNRFGWSAVFSSAAILAALGAASAAYCVGFSAVAGGDRRTVRTGPDFLVQSAVEESPLQLLVQGAVAVNETPAGERMLVQRVLGEGEAADRKMVQGPLEISKSSARDPCKFITAKDGTVTLVNTGPCDISLANRDGVSHEYTLAPRGEDDHADAAEDHEAEEAIVDEFGANGDEDDDKEEENHHEEKRQDSANSSKGNKTGSANASDNVSEKATSHQAGGPGSERSGAGKKVERRSNNSQNNTVHADTQSKEKEVGKKGKGKGGDGEGQNKGSATKPSSVAPKSASKSEKHHKAKEDEDRSHDTDEKKAGGGSNASSDGNASFGIDALSAGTCDDEKGECCSTFGCGHRYDPAQACQCNQECETYANCCADFKEICPSPTPNGSEVPEAAEQTPAPSAEPTPEPTKEIGFPSLFCFSVIRSEGYEIGLVGAQFDRHASIFACDSTVVFSNGPSIRFGTIDTISMPAEEIGVGNLELESDTTNSWLNTNIFLRVWQWVVADVHFQTHDWSVKVDPDAVFFPERLRDHVKPYTPPGGANYYFTNCNKVYAPNPEDEVFPEKLFGALEVISKQAVQAYQAGHQRCKDELEWHGWGEDYFMQSCLNLLGVLPVGDFGMVGDKRCFDASCSDTGKVAFHDFKDITAYFDCWEQSLGPAGVQMYEEGRA